jgi:hypothetical protein
MVPNKQDIAAIPAIMSNIESIIGRSCNRERITYPIVIQQAKFVQNFVFPIKNLGKSYHYNLLYLSERKNSKPILKLISSEYVMSFTICW